LFDGRERTIAAPACKLPFQMSLFERNVRQLPLGCCVADDVQLAVIEPTGADYAEPPVASAVMSAGFDSLRPRLETSPTPARAANVFLPGDLPVVGPAVDQARIEAYVSEAMARLAGLGVRVLVFGSGKARSIPDGFDRARALDQLEAFTRLAAGTALANGVVLAVEPLRRAESNVLNSVREAAAFVRERGIADARVLADLYHMQEEGEDLGALDDSADLLAHTHVADSGRTPPGQGDWDLEGFLERLRTVGYTGACSIECIWSDFAAEAPAAVAHMRSVAERAGWSVSARNGHQDQGIREGR
jgi:sugar phosphate isomerase/epimerase